MWICSKFGFFSAVQKPGGQVHVRARRRQDLENLVDAMDWKKPPVIHESDPQADYRFRIVVGWRGWWAVMETLTDHLDYPNFKGQIAQDPDQCDKLGIYSDFHHAMERYQNQEDEPADQDEPDPWEGFDPPRLEARD